MNEVLLYWGYMVFFFAGVYAAVFFYWRCCVPFGWMATIVTNFNPPQLGFANEKQLFHDAPGGAT